MSIVKVWTKMKISQQLRGQNRNQHRGVEREYKQTVSQPGHYSLSLSLSLSRRQTWLSHLFTYLMHYCFKKKITQVK